MTLKEKLAELAMLAAAKEKWMFGFDNDTSFVQLGKGLYLQGFEKAREMAIECVGRNLVTPKVYAYDLLSGLGEEEVKK